MSVFTLLEMHFFKTSLVEINITAITGTGEEKKIPPPKHARKVCLIK